MSEDEEADIEAKRASTQQARANTAKTYVDMGALDSAEVRQGLAQEGEFQIEDLLDGTEYETDLWGGEGDFNDFDIKNSLPSPALYGTMIKSDADEKWKTINGTPVPVGENGELEGAIGERIVKSEHTNSERGSDVETKNNNFGKGFEGDSGKDHLDKRHQEGNYTDVTLEQYESAALDLLNQEVGGDILGFDGKDGNVYRWNKQTGDYAIGEPNVRVVTMYPLRGGEERFNNLKAKKEKED